jgi:elongation factor P
VALVGANELKRKTLIEVEGQPFAVVEVFHASPTARGATTMVRTRLRNLLTGAVLEKSFRSGEKFAEPDVALAPASFLYADAEGSHFMDEENYEQFMLTGEAVGDDRGYLKEGLRLQILKYNGEAVSIELPQYVELTVVRTEPGVSGDRAAGRDLKPATLETGLKINVPPHIAIGDMVSVDTRESKYLGRAK